MASTYQDLLDSLSAGSKGESSASAIDDIGKKLKNLDKVQFDSAAKAISNLTTQLDSLNDEIAKNEEALKKSKTKEAGKAFAEQLKKLGKEVERNIEATKKERETQKKLGKAGFDATEKAGSLLNAQLEALKEQVESNVKATKKALSTEQISSAMATKLIRRQLSAVNDLNDAIKSESENRELGAKELGNFSDRVKAVGKELGEEKDLLKARNRGEKKYLLELKMRAKDAIRSKTKAAAGVADRLRDQLGTNYAGSGIVGAAQQKLGSKGGRKAVAGAAGLGLLAAGFAKIVDIQRKNLAAQAPRIFNYGLEAGDIDSTLARTAKLMTSIRTDARDIGQDADMAAASAARIIAETGEELRDTAKASKLLSKNVQFGLGSIDEIGSLAIERMNSLGISSMEAGQEMQDIALQAKALQRVLGSGKAIQMDDFFKSIQTVSGAVGSLVTNQKDLAKTMGLLISRGSKLELSYNRRRKAAEGLTTALAANYDQGFATLEINEDLATAARSKNKTLRRDVGRITENLQSGLITEVQAARQFKEVGGTTDAGVVSAKLERTLDDFLVNSSLAEARLGTELSADMVELIKDLATLRATGLSTAQATDKLRATGRDVSGLDTLSKEIGKRSKTGKSLIDATLDEVSASIAGVFQSNLSLIAGFLENISVSVKFISDLFGGGKTAKEVKEEKAAEVAKAEKRAAVRAEVESKNSSISSLVDQIAKVRGDDVGLFESKRDVVEGFAKDKGMQSKFREQMKGGFSSANVKALEAILGKEKAAAVIKNVGTGSANLANAQVTSKLTAAGDLSVHATVKGAQAQADQMRNVNNANKNAAGRR